MTLMWREIFEQPDALRHCREQNQTTLQALVDAVNRFRPHTVVFTGRGSSDHAGQYGKYLIEIYKGLPVSLASPSVITDYAGSVDYGGCLVIGISQSGQTRDVLSVLLAAKAQGALTVAITNDAGSPVVGAADYHLFCAVGEEKSLEATKTFAAQCYLLFLLVAQWSGHAALVEKAASVPDVVFMALTLGEAVSALAPRYRFAQEMFILARGTELPLAMEACLKINESSYVRARPFSISDFLHGPVAMVEKDTPVILIDVETAVRGSTTGILPKLHACGADLLAVTSDPVLAKESDASILIPKGYDGPEAAFTVMAIMQMFACKLSLLKGNNPDQPRGLQKVTG